MNIEKSVSSNSNLKLISHEELRKNLLNINNSFCNYIKSLNKDFDESPEHLNNSMKYSKELINEFTDFYKQFNLLSEEVLKDDTNQKQKISSPKEIIIDNAVVKYYTESLKSSIDKLKRKNEETANTIKGYENDVRKLFDSGSNKNLK